MEFITVEQIKTHRATRKESGVAGCVNGEDALPAGLTNMKGISWRPMNPLNPSCFCHDCRGLWDPTGTIDLELLKKGNTRALFTYSSILPSKKDILRDLRSKTDDALEDFIKTQSFLTHTLAELNEVEKELDTKNKLYEYLSTHGYMFSNNPRMKEETDLLSEQLNEQTHRVSTLQQKIADLEESCRSMERTYVTARKNEMEFLDKNL